MLKLTIFLIFNVFEDWSSSLNLKTISPTTKMVLSQMIYTPPNDMSELVTGDTVKNDIVKLLGDTKKIIKDLEHQIKIRTNN